MLTLEKQEYTNGLPVEQMTTSIFQTNNPDCAHIVQLLRNQLYTVDIGNIGSRKVEAVDQGNWPSSNGPRNIRGIAGLFQPISAYMLIYLLDVVFPTSWKLVTYNVNRVATKVEMKDNQKANFVIAMHIEDDGTIIGVRECDSIVC